MLTSDVPSADVRHTNSSPDDVDRLLTFLTPQQWYGLQIVQYRLLLKPYKIRFTSRYLTDRCSDILKLPPQKPWFNPCIFYLVSAMEKETSGRCYCHLQRLRPFTAHVIPAIISTNGAFIIVSDVVIIIIIIIISLYFQPNYRGIKGLTFKLIIFIINYDCYTGYLII